MAQHIFRGGWDKACPTFGRVFHNLRTAAALALGLGAALVAAERSDITLNDGTVLRSARVVAVGSDQVQILHEGGLTSLPIDKVPLDLVARAHMAQEAKAVDPERQAIEELAATRVAENDQKVYDQAQKDRIAKARRTLEADGVQCFFKVLQVIPGEGVLVAGRDAYRYVDQVVQTRTVVQDTGLSSHKKKIVTGTSTERVKVPVALGEAFFVQMTTAGIVDGQVLFGRLWRIGEYHYTSVQQAGRTVPKFTRDAITYLDYLLPPKRPKIQSFEKPNKPVRL